MAKLPTTRRGLETAFRREHAKVQTRFTQAGVERAMVRLGAIEQALRDDYLYGDKEIQALITLSEHETFGFRGR